MEYFDEYIKATEPSRRQRAENWRTAIGLQAVDQLHTSDYLREIARRNIEGEITMAQAQELVRSYYERKTDRTPQDDETEEADRVAANISRILGEPSFAFSIVGITSIHRRIFDGVFKFAGKIRDYDITKREWVLRGDTVLYVGSEDLHRALEYDLQQEKDFSYQDLSMDDTIAHLAAFVSNLWQIHPFGEGNTRTTAVFFIKYLRSMGFSVDNDLFAKHSWYFRNALVRANYRNRLQNIEPEPLFLVRFLRNLLLGENNDLRNRYMLLNPPAEWQAEVDRMKRELEGQTPHKYPTSTPQVEKLIQIVGHQELSIKEMLSMMELKDRKNFLEVYLNPAMRDGFVTMRYPDSPRHPRQRYRLTVKGLAVYNQEKTESYNE